MAASTSGFVGPCPFCAEEILLAVRKCKHCGEWLTKPEDSAANAAAEQRISEAKAVVIESDNGKASKGQPGPKGAVPGCVECLGFLVMLALFIGHGSGSSTGRAEDKQQDAEPRKIDATVMSETFVKRNLKAPATADFPWYSDPEVTAHDLGSGQYWVSSYVDSQNSFGAKIRTRYRCRLQDDGNDHWMCVDLNLDE
jgi:hypothetical protein